MIMVAQGRNQGQSIFNRNLDRSDISLPRDFLPILLFDVFLDFWLGLDGFESVLVGDVRRKLAEIEHVRVTQTVWATPSQSLSTSSTVRVTLTDKNAKPFYLYFSLYQNQNHRRMRNRTKKYLIVLAVRETRFPLIFCKVKYLILLFHLN